MSSHPPGIFGQSRAAANETECQGRGDLHGHSLAWTVLTPEVLQFVANKERLAAKVAEVIDFMIISCMNLSDRITSVANKTLNQQLLCPIWQPQSNPVHDSLVYDNLVTMVFIAVQIHSHSDTCKKGKNGRFHCRLLFGRVPANNTRPIELFLEPQNPDQPPSDMNIDRTHILNVEENISDWIREEPDWETSAMPKSDPRIIYWDTKRPLFEYSDIFINNDLHPDLLQILPQDVIQEIRQFSPNQKK